MVEDPLSELAVEFWTGIASFNTHVLQPIVDITPADLFAIVADGVPAEVRRHRIVAPKLHHGEELKVEGTKVQKKKID